MSATLSTDRPARGHKEPGAFSRLFARLCATGSLRYFVRRAAIAMPCANSTTAHLRDIGLVRSQIEAAVHGFMTDPDRRDG